MRPIFPLFIFLTAISLCGPAVMGEPAAVTPAPSATATPAEGPTPIPLPEVATQAGDALERLQNIEANLAAELALVKPGGNIDTLLRGVEADVSEGTKSLASNRSFKALQDFETACKKKSEALAGWMGELAKRLRLHDSDFNELEQLSKVWTQTLELARSNSAGKPVTGKIETLIAAIRETSGAVQKRRSAVFTLQTRAKEQIGRLNAALASVRQASAQAVFVRDSPQIWSLQVQSGVSRNLWEESGSSLSKQWTALLAYADPLLPLFIVHGLFCLLLVAGVRWTRRRVQPWAEESPVRQHAVVVFEVPLATALAVSLVPGFWLYQDAPPLFQAILGAACLIPAILILRRLIEPGFIPLLNALGVFYAVDQLRAITASIPAVSRWLFFAEMAGGLIFLARILLRPLPLATSEGKDFSRVVRAGAWVAAGGFSGAMLANLLGHVSLANLLGNATLGSAYLAVILYAASRISDGLLMGLFSMRPFTELHTVLQHRSLIWHRSRRVIQVVVVMVWALGTLDMLSLRSPCLEGLQSLLTVPQSDGSHPLSAFGKILAFAVTVWSAFLISRFLRFVLEEDCYPRMQLERGLSYAISTMLHYGVLLAGFLMAAAAAKVDMTQFTILAGAFGVGMGFGLQNIINNFVSGLILLFERPIKVGDVVQMDAASGVVDRIGIRASIIRTGTGSEIIVPNAKLISDQVTNWTLSNRHRGIQITLGVAYGADPCRVIEVLEGVAKRHPQVMSHPAPNAVLKDFGPDALQFELQAWTAQFDQWGQIRSDLAVAINAAFIREGIVMPYPQRELHLRSVAPEILSQCFGAGGVPPRGAAAD